MHIVQYLTAVGNQHACATVVRLVRPRGAACWGSIVGVRNIKDVGWGFREVLPVSCLVGAKNEPSDISSIARSIR